MNPARELLPGLAPPPVRLALYVVAIVVATALARPDLYRARSESLVDDHAILSMELAMSDAFCDAPSAVSLTVRVPYEVRDHPELGVVPVRQLAEERAGSLARYCQSVVNPLLNNENSLTWLESWLWRIQPDASVVDIGRLLHLLRVAAVLVFCAVLLVHGFGLVVALAAWWWALVLLQGMQSHVHSAYPFLPVLLLLTASVYATVNTQGWARSVVGAAVIGGLTGAWTAFAANMRTSHLPVYLLFAIVLFVLGERVPVTLPMRNRRPTRIVLAASLFVIGYAAFQYVAISRHLPESNMNLPRHTVAHPLVLALGLPESDFSRRQRIRWSDSAALEIARRIEPSVSYLGPDYERVLFSYYRGLWRDHPGEMIDVYLRKARLAGKHMLGVLRSQGGTEGRALRTVLAPLDLLPNGMYLLSLYGIVALGATVQAWRKGGGAVLLAYLALAAVLLDVESVAIMSAYVANYHSYLAFFCVFLSISAVTFAMGAIWDRLATMRLARG